MTQSNRLMVAAEPSWPPTVKAWWASMSVQFNNLGMEVTVIGLSLSFCVRDIAEGLVELSAVDKIITATRIVSEDDWNTVIQQYQQVYWRHCPDIAATIVLELRVSGKIEQPRLLDTYRMPRIAGGHWVNSEADIVWADRPADE